MHEEFIGTGWAFPMGVERHRRHRHGPPRAGARAGHAAHPVDLPGRAADAARVRLPPARLRVPAVPATRPPACSAMRSGPPSPGGSPACDIEMVTVTPDPVERNLLFIDIKYSVKATNDRRNLVFPFYTIPDEEPASDTDGASRSQPRRPPVPGPRRRRQAPGPAPVSRSGPTTTSPIPGVTLIETFAFMTDQLLYRLNRVPDRLYIKFLELIGVHLLPPTPARAPVTFWLSSPAVALVMIATNTKVGDDPHRDRGAGDLLHRRGARRSSRAGCRASAPRRNGERGADQPHRGAEAGSPVSGLRRASDAGRRAAGLGSPSRCPATPCGSTSAATSTASASTRTTRRWCGRRGTVAGGPSARSPRTPPAASTATARSRCTSRPITRPVSSTSERAGWLRARVVEADEGQPDVQRLPDHPRAHRLHRRRHGRRAARRDHRERGARRIRGRARAAVLGRCSSRCWPGPALRSWRSAPTRAGRSGTQVEHFAASGPDDRHYVLDAVNGEVVLGPMVREADGGHPPVRRRAAEGGVRPDDRRTPSAAAGRATSARGAIRTLKSSIPFVAGVENRRSARDGVDGETIGVGQVARTDHAADAQPGRHGRGLRADHPRGGARGGAGPLPGRRCRRRRRRRRVKVLLVPAARPGAGADQVRGPRARPQTFERVKDELDETRLHRHARADRAPAVPGRHRGGPTRRQAARRARRGSRTEALEALYAYLNPLTGGPDGNGWPFGRPVQSGEVYAALQRIRGVDLVEDVRVFGANPVTGERGKQTTRIELEPNSLVFSYEHQVRVEGQ